jgi:hypothetical protein
MNVSFSGTVPVDITIDVDTDPFDNSVSGVKRSVDVLTGAVVAMNAAQRAAIQRTTDEVAKSLIDGFFGTIKTEISQKLPLSQTRARSALICTPILKERFWWMIRRPKCCFTVILLPAGFWSAI